MPDRVVKESIGTSDSLAKVSLLASLFWANFLTVMDDYGCFDARVPVIKSKLFPLRDDVTTEMIEGWLQEFASESVNMIRFWAEPNGVRFGQCVSFETHNDIVSKKRPTTPCPPWLKPSSGIDSRLGTETLQAFERIAVAVAKLQNGSKSPTFREICKEAGCSPSTLAKYRKHTAATARYSTLQLATGTTAKNQKVKVKENQNEKEKKGKQEAPVDDRRVPFRDFTFDALRAVGIEPVTNARTWKALEELLDATRGKEIFSLEKLKEYFMRLVNSPNPFHRSQADQILFFCKNVSAFMRNDDNGTRQQNGRGNQSGPARSGGLPAIPYTPKQR